MTTQINFRDFQGFEHLKEFVQLTVDQTIGKLDMSRFADVNITIGTDHARHDGRSPFFMCEATLKVKSQKVFVKKVDVDFQASVRKCMKAACQILVKKHTMKRQKHRQGLSGLAQMSYSEPGDLSPTNDF